MHLEARIASDVHGGRVAMAAHEDLTMEYRINRCLYDVTDVERALFEQRGSKEVWRLRIRLAGSVGI